MDYLLVFIPNESVYAFIHEHDPELVDFALAQKVVLCSPFTLFPVLAVIRQAMDNFMVDQTSAEILRCLGAFTDQWEKLAEAIDKVGSGSRPPRRPSATSTAPGAGPSRGPSPRSTSCGPAPAARRRRPRRARSGPATVA